MRLKDKLKEIIPKEKWKYLPSSFEIIGSREKAIAIVEIDENLNEFEKEIGKAIAELHKNVNVVLRKLSERIGEERIRKFKRIYGNENTEVIHKENGYLIKVDPTKVYFSAKEGEERKRIALKVKENENVLVMFSGVAPFAIAIAKFQPKVNKIYCIELNKIANEYNKIYCIELNKIANEYAKENVKINKVSEKVVLIEGKVEDVWKKIEKKFDRIIMPLPLKALEYLEIAIKLLKKDGIIHLYGISKEENLFKDIEERIEKIAKNLNVKFEIVERRKISLYAPRKWKVRIDIKVRK